MKLRLFILAACCVSFVIAGCSSIQDVPVKDVFELSCAEKPEKLNLDGANRFLMKMTNKTSQKQIICSTHFSKSFNASIKREIFNAKDLMKNMIGNGTAFKLGPHYNISDFIVVYPGQSHYFEHEVELKKKPELIISDNDTICFRFSYEFFKAKNDFDIKAWYGELSCEIECPVGGQTGK